MGRAKLRSKDSKALWALSYGVCAFPTCKTPVIETQVDAQTGETFTTVIGEEAHIHSPTPQGPRYDSDYPKAKLETAENRILLCPVHHTMVDDEGGRAYTAEALREMRRRHLEQHETRQRLEGIIQSYLRTEFERDNHIQFSQVRLEGPSVDAMFVDVPWAASVQQGHRAIGAPAASWYPMAGAAEVGAAQSLLNPSWTGNAVIIGGPGQGKSTLLQYVCQFHRSRRLSLDNEYTGAAQGLNELTSTNRIPIRIDLRMYSEWASGQPKPRQTGRYGESGWPTLEEFITEQIKHVSGQKFRRRDLTVLIATEPILFALDGLDEVANLQHRDIVGQEIIQTQARLLPDASDLVILVTSRPGSSRSPIWRSHNFPVFYLQPLPPPLRVLYLKQWCATSQLAPERAKKLERIFLEKQNQPHIRDLAGYPMQLAILLHLLHQKGLLPEQRTDLYAEYLKTFLDREQSENKEPMLATHRRVIVDVHGYLGWHLQREAEREDAAGRISRQALERELDTYLADRAKGRQLAQQLFAAIEGRVLCLVEREVGFFEFEVPSLREYFAASHINDYSSPRGDKNNKLACFEALLERPYWLNVTRFLVGMFSIMEVGAIPTSLRQMQARRHQQLHSHLRYAASRFLDDRAFQSQGDETVKTVVEFILDGPGLVLAEDGFLDESGRPLQFVEDTGQEHAIACAKGRLATNGPVGDMVAAAQLLKRHTSAEEAANWWWAQFEPTDIWLTVAGELGCLHDCQQYEDRITQVAESVTGPIVERLTAAACDSRNSRVVNQCISDLNDGALWTATPGHGTPLGRLVAAARSATRVFTTGRSSLRTRRRKSVDSQLSRILQSTVQYQQLPAPGNDHHAWMDRLAKVADLWGHDWVLRHAVARLPQTVNFASDGLQFDTLDDVTCQILHRQIEARKRRADVDWWKAWQSELTQPGEFCYWVVCLITQAHNSVTASLAGQISDTVDNLTVWHYRALREAIKDLTGAHGTQLNLQDQLRRSIIQLSPRALWLVRVAATEQTIAQIDSKIASAPDCLTTLLPVADGTCVNELLRVAGSRRVIRPSALDGTRSLLNSQAWDDVNLGAVTAKQARAILKNPGEWPTELISRAMQVEAGELEKLSAIAGVASEHHWFQIS